MTRRWPSSKWCDSYTAIRTGCWITRHCIHSAPTGFSSHLSGNNLSKKVLKFTHIAAVMRIIGNAETQHPRYRLHICISAWGTHNTRASAVKWTETTGLSGRCARMLRMLGTELWRHCRNVGVYFVDRCVVAVAKKWEVLLSQSAAYIKSESKWGSSGRDK